MPQSTLVTQAVDYLMVTVIGGIVQSKDSEYIFSGATIEGIICNPQSMTQWRLQGTVN